MTRIHTVDEQPGKGGVICRCPYQVLFTHVLHDSSITDGFLSGF